MRELSLASTLACLFMIAGCGSAFTGPAESAPPTIVVDRPMPAPQWAKQQRRLMALHGEMARLIDQLHFEPDGRVRVRMEHGGGTMAPDDVMESLYKLPLYYALGADAATWELYWRAWRGTTKQGIARGLYVNEMPKYLDWHHNGEHFAGFWLGAMCAPHDKEYRRLALQYASLYDGSDRPHQNYDPDAKVIPSILHGGAGPQFNPTVEDWIGGEVTEGARQFWSAWLDCDHDGPINLVTTNFGTVAFMLTGEAHWRDRTMQYIDAWQRRAKANDGIIPSIVDRDGTVPDAWWKGVMGWNFKRFGGLFMVSSGPRAAWGNAALLTGETTYYQPMRTLADVLWEHRHKVKEDLGWGIEQGDWDVPRYYNGEQQWHGGLERAAGVYANILANLWLTTMEEADLDRVLARANIQGAAGHATWQEGGYEPQWIKYLQGKNDGWPEAALGRLIERAEGDVAQLKRRIEAGEDDRKQRTWPHHWGWAGPLVNLMTGGPMPLWHGQLHMARFRYFDPGRGRPGLPADCAALVRKLDDDSATLTLVNIGDEGPRTVLVQTGAYAEHQCVSVTPSDGEPVDVDGSLFAVVLPPGSGQTFTVKMKRFANTPTLSLPWRRQR